MPATMRKEGPAKEIALAILGPQTGDEDKKPKKRTKRKKPYEKEDISFYQEKENSYKTY